MGQGGGQAGQGPGRTVDLLRLPGGTLEAYPEVKSDPKHFRHCPALFETHQGVPQLQDRAGHGVQVDDVGAEEIT